MPLLPLLDNGVMWYTLSLGSLFSLVSLLFSLFPFTTLQESMFLVILCVMMYELLRVKLVSIRGFLFGYFTLLAITGTKKQRNLFIYLFIFVSFRVYSIGISKHKALSFLPICTLVFGNQPLYINKVQVIVRR